MRDDFSAVTARILAARVAFRCSNPNCLQLTIGPHESEEKSVSIGVAAHICAASSGGPRYNPNMTPEERRSLSNGIWLCQNCARRIDVEPETYPSALLRNWKEQMEAATKKEYLQTGGTATIPGLDPLHSCETMMPELFAEIREDLNTHPLWRKFVLKKKSWNYWAESKEIFAYYYEEHPELDSKLEILINHGLVRDVTHGANIRKFIITEELAKYLINTREAETKSLSDLVTEAIAKQQSRLNSIYADLPGNYASEQWQIVKAAWEAELQALLNADVNYEAACSGNALGINIGNCSLQLSINWGPSTSNDVLLTAVCFEHETILPGKSEVYIRGTPPPEKLKMQAKMEFNAARGDWVWRINHADFPEKVPGSHLPEILLRRLFRIIADRSA